MGFKERECYNRGINYHLRSALLKKLSLLLIISLFSTQLFALEWKYEKEITLKKDQFFSVWVNSQHDKKLLKFRWTLFKNSNLVLLKVFDDFNTHHILSEYYSHNSIKFDVGIRSEKYRQKPYILIKFERFNVKKNEASFKLLLNDKTEQINIEIVK